MGIGTERIIDYPLDRSSFRGGARVSLLLCAWTAKRGSCGEGEERGGARVLCGEIDEQHSASHGKGRVPARKGVGKVCSSNVKRMDTGIPMKRACS